MTPSTEHTARSWRLIALALALALMQVGAIAHITSIPGDLIAQISLPVPLEIAADSLWALIFTVMAVNLLRSRATPVRWIIAGFATYSTVRLALFARADYDHNRLPFLVVANLLALLMTFFLRR